MKRLIAALKVALLALALLPAASSLMSTSAQADETVITVCFGGANACPVENEEKKTGIIIVGEE